VDNRLAVMTARLSNEGAAIIETLRFDPQAQMGWSILPLGSVYWTDELPPLKFLAFKRNEDQRFVMQLFAIRINFWTNGEMNDEEVTYWNEAKTRFPNWPIFQRLNATDEIKREHEQCQKQMEEFFTTIADEADEFERRKDGDYFESFSAKFDLTKDE
jgi:hypothetical protein